MDLNVLSTHLANKDNSNTTIKDKLNTSKDNQKAQQKSGYKTLSIKNIKTVVLPQIRKTSISATAQPSQEKKKHAKLSG